MRFSGRGAVLLGAAVLAGLGLPGGGSAALAQSGGLVARWDAAPGADRRASAAIPALLSAEERSYYTRLFGAIEARQWSLVESLLAERPEGLLHQLARAKYYTHADSPKASAEQIAAWLDAGTHLPQAEQLIRMGASRGLPARPLAAAAPDFYRQPGAPKRILPRSVADGTMPAATAAAILAAIKHDAPYEAQRLLAEVDPGLSSDARAEWRQRVAWSHYIENDDAAALALAQTVAEGSGEWVAEGAWVEGLAAWRLDECALAADAFGRAAARAGNPELAAAAHFWAHRALMRCREPRLAERYLAAATNYDETLYGMLAAEQLGIALPAHAPIPELTRADWEALAGSPNVPVAAALAEIGRASLADEVLRHEARTGPAYLYPERARLARALGLPGAQLFMARHVPYGMRSEAALHFPVAAWQPVGGWQVDPALAFAHALQESNFRADAVSPAKARGLMQITPITVREHAPRLNMSAAYVNLDDPEVNLAFGQRNLEMLRDAPATGGLLPKIIAAYNAGLSPLTRWNSEIRDFGDPLLWMESIPYWETRSYVAIVMRNYWMYERAAGRPSPSRRALAQGQWPEFPRAGEPAPPQARR